jgi:hypothetical protein
MHAPSHLLLDPPECRPHAISPGDPLHEKLPTAVAFANEGKTQEAEGLRLAASALSAPFGCKAAEFDQAGFGRME